MSRPFPPYGHPDGPMEELGAEIGKGRGAKSRVQQMHHTQYNMKNNSNVVMNIESIQTSYNQPKNDQQEIVHRNQTNANTNQSHGSLKQQSLGNYFSTHRIETNEVKVLHGQEVSQSSIPPQPISPINNDLFYDTEQMTEELNDMSFKPAAFSGGTGNNQQFNAFNGFPNYQYHSSSGTSHVTTTMSGMNQQSISHQQGQYPAVHPYINPIRKEVSAHHPTQSGMNNRMTEEQRKYEKIKRAVIEGKIFVHPAHRPPPTQQISYMNIHPSGQPNTNSQTTSFRLSAQQQQKIEQNRKLALQRLGVTRMKEKQYT